MQALMASVVFTTQLVAFGPTSVNPKWNSDYGKALEAARTAKRPLVVLIENPKMPEQSLDRRALSKVADSNKLLAKYELCNIDVTTDVGKRVAKAFGATQLPYTAVTDSKAQKVVYRGSGHRRPKQWIAMLVARTTPKTTAFKVSHRPQSHYGASILGTRPTYTPETCFT